MPLTREFKDTVRARARSVTRHFAGGCFAKPSRHSLPAISKREASPTEPVNAAWWTARSDHLAPHRRERAKKRPRRRRA